MITPKPFQQTYIGNVLTLFRGAKSHLDEVASDFERRRVFAYNGACLLKAPTGAGKTLIAGTVAEQFSKEEKLVWLWFAPFKGLVGQAAKKRIPTIMPGERFGAQDEPIIQSLRIAREQNARFPGFESDVHGLIIDNSGAQPSYKVEVLKL